MAKVRTRFPKIFVGHQFGKRFPIKKFRGFFKELPFEVNYGNTDIQTKHLLRILKDHLRKVDFAVFDLSGWNPNVALELGLCEGTGSRAQKEYYIVLNTTRANEVPSDIRGLQRLEYTKFNYEVNRGLGYQLLFLLKKEYWTKKLVQAIGTKIKEANLDKALIGGLKILAHFRDFEQLDTIHLNKLFHGLRLRENDRQAVIDAILELGLIRRKTANIFVVKKTFFSVRKGNGRTRRSQL